MKNKIIRITGYLLLIVCIAFIIGISRKCVYSESMIYQEGYSGGDTIDLAILYGPGSLYIYSDTLSGLNREISRNFSRDTRLPVKIWPVANAEDAMNRLENGAFDILAAIPLDNNIRKRFQTSQSIYLDRMVFIQLADSLTGSTIINSSLDLTDITVYVSDGSPAFQRLENLSKEIGGEIKIISGTDLSDELLSLKVANGSIPFAVVNEKIAMEVASRYPRLSYSNPISFTQFQVWLFNREDSTLANIFNSWFDTFRLTDEYRILLNQY